MNFICMSEPVVNQPAEPRRMSPHMARILGVPETPETPVVTAPPTAAPSPAPNPTDNPPAPVVDEDTAFLTRYNKIHGTEFTTIKEITNPKPQPTREEIEAAEQQEKADAFDWALKSGVFKKEDYDKSVIEKSKSARDIAFGLFADEYKAENATAKDDEIEQKFKEFYAEYDEPDTWRHKQGQKQMKKVADEYLKQFNNIDSHYDSYKQYKTVAEKSKAFKSTLKGVAESLPSEITFEIPVEKEGKTENIAYAFPVDADMKEDIYKEYSKNNWAFDAFGAAQNEVKAKDLIEAMTGTLNAKYVGKMIQHIASEHGKRMRQDLLAELKGIPVTKPAPSILSAQAPITVPVIRSTAAKERIGV